MWPIYVDSQLLESLPSPIGLPIYVGAMAKVFCQQPSPPLPQLPVKYNPRVECLLDLSSQLDHNMPFITPSSDFKSSFPTHS